MTHHIQACALAGLRDSLACSLPLPFTGAAEEGTNVRPVAALYAALGVDQ